MNFVFYKPVVPISGICTSLAGYQGRIQDFSKGSARFISKTKKNRFRKRNFPVLH